MLSICINFVLYHAALNGTAIRHLRVSNIRICAEKIHLKMKNMLKLKRSLSNLKVNGQISGPEELKGSCTKNQRSLQKNQRSPPKNQRSPPKNQRSPPINQRSPPKNQKPKTNFGFWFQIEWFLIFVPSIFGSWFFGGDLWFFWGDLWFFGGDFWFFGDCHCFFF